MSEQSESPGAAAAEPATETETAATPAPEAAAPAPAPVPTEPEGRANRRKVREGLVVSTKMEKTAVVAVVERVRHPRYVKTVQRTKRLYADDPNSDVRVGDRVRLAETRPLSKLKHWRIIEVLERAK